MYVLHVFEITKKFKENKKLPLKIQHNFSKLADTIVQDSFYTISREKRITNSQTTTTWIGRNQTSYLQITRKYQDETWRTRNYRKSNKTMWEVRNPKIGNEVISLNFLLLDEKLMFSIF